MKHTLALITLCAWGLNASARPLSNQWCQYVREKILVEYMVPGGPKTDMDQILTAFAKDSGRFIINACEDYAGPITDEGLELCKILQKGCYAP